jgi:flagellar basal body-associated protein FliL
MRLLFFVLAWLWATPLQAADTMDSVPRYVSFPAIIVNTSDGIDYNGLFSVKVQLQVNSPAAHEQAEALRPIFQDALTQATYRLAQLYVDPRKPVPWARLKKELESAVQRVAGKTKIRVLILEATTRPS